MRSPDAVLQRLRTRWRNQRGEWLLQRGDWPLGLPIDPPSERVAAAHWSAFDAWLVQWREARFPGRVEFVERSWPGLGSQRLPVRWLLASPAEAAQALGEGLRWDTAVGRRSLLQARWPDAPAEWVDCLPRHFDLLADLSEPEFDRLVSVVDALYRNHGVGLRPRQLPVAGVHSKWLASYRGVVTDWLCALRGESDTREFHAVTGLVGDPARLRLRVLDPALALPFGGLRDIEAPVDELAAASIAPRSVLIVENRESGLSCEPLDGAVVLMGMGYAVDVLSRLPWVRGVSIVYWGDIDTHGLAILDRVRTVLPQTRSVLMDESTLLQHRALWSREERQHPGGTLVHLADDERTLFHALRSGVFGPQVRLEQERLAWSVAWAAIKQAVANISR